MCKMWKTWGCVGGGSTLSKCHVDRVAVNMDDIIVCGKGIEEHNYQLQKVMERLQSSCLKINNDKCELRKT